MSVSFRWCRLIPSCHRLNAIFITGLQKTLQRTDFKALTILRCSTCDFIVKGF
ncbi:hypothetical protein I79_021285 [Cricetulus griseus]|uniref:Uncharacterized protein n=1 Tax=Cricetulus griseus TaxID=10029 RepID=G3IC95_CRIGR|nr:hypothetical protein I79_021285 [Cricetulus griseus]